MGEKVLSPSATPTSLSGNADAPHPAVDADLYHRREGN
jgi:hypothetical protein